MKKLPVPFYLILFSTLFFQHKALARIELGASKEEAEINVGCLYPLTGFGSALGQDSIMGMELALEDIKKKYPELPKIRVIVEDTKLKTSRAIRLSRNLVKKENIKFLCGVVSSSIALEIAKTLDDLGVIMIGTDHASSRLTSQALVPNYFRVTNNSRQSQYAGAMYIKKAFSNTIAQRPLKVAYIGPDYDYGYQSWSDFRNAMVKLKVEIDPVAVLWPNLFEVDYSAYIDAFLDVKADIIISSLWGNDFRSFLLQGAKTNLFKISKLANFDTGANFENFAKLGDQMPLGIIMSARHHLNWPDTETNIDFVQKFHRKTGLYPSYSAEGGYSGILSIAAAIAKTKGDTSLENLRAAFKGLSIKLPEDPIGFESFIDPNTHQIQQVIAIGMSEANNKFPPATRMLGSWKIFFPKDMPE